jgi:hypothetical protein
MGQKFFTKNEQEEKHRIAKDESQNECPSRNLLGYNFKKLLLLGAEIEHPAEVRVLAGFVDCGGMALNASVG